MAQATYSNETFEVTFEATLEQCDYGVERSPVWGEITDAMIVEFKLLGVDIPVGVIPDNVYDTLIEYAYECEEWE